MMRIHQPPAFARRVLAAALFGLAIGVSPPVARAEGQDLLVFAAASLKDALDDVNALYERDKHQKATTSYAASSALAKQIEAGAPADVFISADLDWMDYLAAKNQIKPATRSNLLGNKLVLVAPASSAVSLTIAPDFPLAQALGDGHLAMADTTAVPAGKYGRAALEKLGVWASVSSKVASAENVRSALLLVDRGEAPLGIVYQTDAAADKGVRIVAAFPADSHPPIIYPIAVTAAAKNPGADAYVAFVRSAAARAAFEKQGFVVLE
jgi:molybdate transport system substrate-binding protein